MLPGQHSRQGRPHPVTDQMTDTADDPIGALLIRIAGGDRVAFRDIYTAASPKLMGVLMRILGSRSEAEDALQEVYTRIWARARRYDPDMGRGMSWLIAVTRNLAIDRLRARPAEARRSVHDEDAATRIPDGRPGAEAGLIALGQARAVVDCMETLEPDRAAAVKGAYLQGLSYQDLAERHAVPLNTMRTWLRRALLRLRECVGT